MANVGDEELHDAVLLLEHALLDLREALARRN